MLRLILGVVVGAALGLGVGWWARCRAGRCPLRRIWWRWAFYGAVAGAWAAVGIAG